MNALEQRLVDYTLGLRFEDLSEATRHQARRRILDTLGGALAAIPFRPFAGFGVVPGLGLWPVLLMLIAENALADPTGSTQFFCFTLSNPVYPWCLAAMAPHFVLHLITCRSWCRLPCSGLGCCVANAST